MHWLLLSCSGQPSLSWRSQTSARLLHSGSDRIHYCQKCRRESYGSVWPSAAPCWQTQASGEQRDFRTVYDSTLGIMGMARHILKSIHIWTVFVACLNYIFHVHLGRNCLERGGLFWLDQFLSFNFNASWPVCLVLYILTVWTWFCHFPWWTCQISDLRSQRSSCQGCTKTLHTDKKKHNISLLQSQLSAAKALRPWRDSSTLMLISNRLFSFWFALVWANCNHEPHFSALFKRA